MSKKLDLYKEDNKILLIINNESIELSSNKDDLYSYLKNSNLESIEKDEIIEKFQMLIKEQVDKELDGVEDTEVNNNGDKISQPYDPDKVKYNLKLFSVLTLYNYMSGYDGEEEPTINLRPEFQRNFVWSNKSKSLVIESILLNIPIPSIYLNQSNDGSYVPADGLQRLNTLKQFLSGEIKLSGLEYLSEYNGYKYKSDNKDKELPINIKRKIRDYQLTCFVIEKETPDKVKLDIFKRLNSTGIRLSQQELRNSITDNKIRDIYKRIEKEDIFDIMIAANVNTNRFVHHEFILRFAGTYFWQYKGEMDYRGVMTEFLDDVLMYLKVASNREVNDMIEKFIVTLNRSYKMFGEDAFRKPTKGRKGPLNTLLFTQILLNLMDYENPINNIVRNDFEDFLYTEKDLLFYLSTATNNIKNIDIVNMAIKKFINELE